MEMHKVKDLLDEQLTRHLGQVVLSSARNRDGIVKAKLRPVLIGGELRFQLTTYIGPKVFHKNLTKEQAACEVTRLLSEELRQLQLESPEVSATALVSKKGKVTLKIKRKDKTETDACGEPELTHNRQKRYLLPEGEPIPFLVDLGVQTKSGAIVKSKYDKFRQINRFLEFVEDVACELPRDRTVSIVDFGCGKSYLTFAMYYYLKIRKNYDIDIVGLDLKKDVIESCSRLRDRYGYGHLTFLQGDIREYNEKEQVDMVVTLHACDTATDYALLKAVKWNARVILSVPCCQHEVAGQLHNELLDPFLKYGILRERMGALLTDGIRANLLEELGYQTQLLEFIDMEHTPKNILIRAVRSDKIRRKSAADIGSLLEQLHTTQTLHELLRDDFLRQQEI